MDSQRVWLVIRNTNPLWRAEQIAALFASRCSFLKPSHLNKSGWWLIIAAMPVLPRCIRRICIRRSCSDARVLAALSAVVTTLKPLVFSAVFTDLRAAVYCWAVSYFFCYRNAVNGCYCRCCYWLWCLLLLLAKQMFQQVPAAKPLAGLLARLWYWLRFGWYQLMLLLFLVLCLVCLAFSLKLAGVILRAVLA